MRASVLEKQFCEKCGCYRDHVLSGRRYEPSQTPETHYVDAKFWSCDFSENILEERPESPWPTYETMILKRLLKLSTDYEQIAGCSLRMEAVRINLTLRLQPPRHIMEILRRVEKCHERGFYRASDLWKLQQYGDLNWPLQDSQVSKTASDRGRTPKLGYYWHNRRGGKLATTTKGEYLSLQDRYHSQAGQCGIETREIMKELHILSKWAAYSVLRKLVHRPFAK